MGIWHNHRYFGFDCRHAAVWGECTVDGCRHNPVQIAENEAVLAARERLRAGFANLPKGLKEKYHRHMADSFCGWSDIVFSQEEIDLLVSVGYAV
jgi:hypothetical protein